MWEFQLLHVFNIRLESYTHGCEEFREKKYIYILKLNFNKWCSTSKMFKTNYKNNV
jgi:hypothetical protein